MPKTVIEKCQSPSPDITVFSVSGTLGFHEKDTLVKLLAECKKRKLSRVIFDVEGLTSLGGGCAKIIGNEAASGELAIGIARAKPTVLKFLKDDNQRIIIAESVDEVASQLGNGKLPDPGVVVEADKKTEGKAKAKETDKEEKAGGEEGKKSAGSKSQSAKAVSPDGTETVDQSAGKKPSSDVSDGDDPVIILGLDLTEEPATGSGAEDSTETAGTNETNREDDKDVTPEETVPSSDKVREPETATTAKELRKRIVQYNTLFTLVSDFDRIGDYKNLLDTFLLTTIAQVGVESAVFLEFHEGYFTPAAVKGLEADDLRGLAISADNLDLDEWKQSANVLALDALSLPDEVKAPLLSIGCSYIAPFVAHDEFRGILVMGKPIRSPLDEGTIGFLKILINQAAMAFERTQRFEEEQKRTLGIVHTLISLIEENTLARGNTNLISHYTQVLAEKLHYPAEFRQDLKYGTVLRDIGMIKVSDLIVRSPRELLPEEWEIIKRHPVDGGEMLRKMKFSEHTITVVVAHHERFNGEGYPNGLQGKQIPLGARIVSIAESYAAMLHDRPTRPALTHEEALNTLKENWGMRYDPDVVAAFVEVVEEEVRSGEIKTEENLQLHKT